MRKTAIPWTDLRQQADGQLAANGHVAEGFRRTLVPLFERMWQRAKRPAVRRPNISLRVIANGSPLAKLITLPGWRSQRHEVDCEQLYCELVVERAIRHPDGDAMSWRKLLTLTLRPDAMKCGLIHTSVVADSQRVIATMVSFLDDKQVVLGRSHDHCCACGRALTDELSRSRGIGPECIQMADFRAWLTTQSVMEPDVPGVPA